MESENSEGKLPEDVKSPEPSDTAEKTKPSGYDFHPIRIKGEPLSETIIRERREGW